MKSHLQRLQAKLVLSEYKMQCAKAIADGDFKKARELKEKINKLKEWLKED